VVQEGFKTGDDPNILDITDCEMRQSIMILFQIKSFLNNKNIKRQQKVFIL
jgi:hypothetical protein